MTVENEQDTSLYQNMRLYKKEEKNQKTMIVMGGGMMWHH